MKNDKLRAGLSREIIMYVIFGALTTVVSFGTYFLIMAAGRALLSVSPDDTVSARYLAVYTAAQLISWVLAVLFAFFTNRRWVFTSALPEGREPASSVLRKLASFAGGRLLTLGLDYVITYAGARVITAVFPSWADVGGVNLADAASKCAASVVVLVCNYFFSRFFVFKKREEKNK